MKKFILYLTTIFLVLPLISSSLYAAASKSVCLDPGHGGTDLGTYYPYNNGDILITEKELNLDIANQVKNLLEDEGVTVYLTRETNDVTLSNRDRYEFCNSKNTDILVSIHHNGSEDPTVDGTMGLYHSHKDDKVLAQYLYDSLFHGLYTDDWAFGDFGLDRFASGVLIKSNMPAAMMEAVFLTNENEGPLLLDTDQDSRRQDIAVNYVEGIKNYFDNVGGGEEDDGNGGDKCPPKNPHCP